MRIVHELEQPMQVSAYSQGPYSLPVGDPGPSVGFRVDLLASTDPNYESYITDVDEDLYLEGDAAIVRSALEEMISQIDTLAEIFVEEGKLSADWKTVRRKLKEETKDEV